MNIETLLSVALSLTLLASSWPRPIGESGWYVARTSIAGSKRNQQWRPGNYRSLVVGKSTQGDMFRLLGSPERVEVFGTPKDVNQEIWNIYQTQTAPAGALTVAVEKRTGTIVEIILAPENLSREEALRIFGDDYITTRYDICPGFEEKDDAPIYESPQGAAKYVEYRGRGIALVVNYRDQVDNILYVSKPVGLTSQRQCRNRIRQLKSIRGRRERFRLL